MHFGDQTQEKVCSISSLTFHKEKVLANFPFTMSESFRPPLTSVVRKNVNAGCLVRNSLVMCQHCFFNGLLLSLCFSVSLHVC